MRKALKNWYFFSAGREVPAGGPLLCKFCATYFQVSRVLRQAHCPLALTKGFNI